MISSILKIFTLITAELVIYNMPVFHLLAVVEVCFLYTFYTRAGLMKRYYVSTLVFLIAFNVLNSLVIQSFSEFNSWAWSFNTLFLTGCGLIYIFQLYQSSETIPVEKNPDFIINAGLLIYCAGSLFTYLKADEILSQITDELFHNGWIIQCISNITKNIIVGYGLWLTKFN